MAQVRGRGAQAVLRSRPRATATGRPGHIRVYVVRHAHAGNRERWTEPDHLRPLSEKGWKQARVLADQLDEVERLLSSYYLRCRQTLEPLAERQGLSILDEARLVEGTAFADALGLITSPGGTAAMCTQGDVIMALVDHLLSRGLVAPSDVGGSKASTWVLDVEAGQITSAAYRPPPK